MITKACPQPAKKQYRVHNLPKSKSGTTTLRKPEPRYVSTNRKRELRFPERDDPGSRKSLKSRLFSLLLCISCQQNYGLDVHHTSLMSHFFRPRLRLMNGFRKRFSDEPAKLPAESFSISSMNLFWGFFMTLFPPWFPSVLPCIFPDCILSKCSDHSSTQMSGYREPDFHRDHSRLQ